MSCSVAGCTEEGTERTGCCRTIVCIDCLDRAGFYEPLCSLANCPQRDERACTACRAALSYECPSCGTLRCDAHAGPDYECGCA